MKSFSQFKNDHPLDEFRVVNDPVTQLQRYIETGSRGDLDLVNTTIAQLPRQLTKIGGSFFAVNSGLESLPSKLVVDGSVNIASTNIKVIPKGLDVAGTLDISRTPIKTLPKGFRVGGGLIARGSKLDTLPDDLTVVGSLVLTETKVDDIPKRLNIGKDLYVNYTPLASRFAKDKNAIREAIESRGGIVRGGIIT